MQVSAVPHKSACKPFALSLLNRLSLWSTRLSSLKKLKDASSLEDVAHLLGYQAKTLAFLLYKLPNASKYTTFRIPKKSGGTREIKAPSERLKELQRRFANLLYNCRKEIEDQKPELKSLSHGFRKSHSIITNAWPHKNRRFVLNLDLENFFPSLNFGRVRGFFLKNQDFVLHERVATVAAQIACHDNQLPQGSPCSPVIADLVAHLLDVRLVQIAKLNRCTYSRYADDLTFSTNQRSFPAALATQTEDPNGWELGESLIQAIERAGFSVNHHKTRMQCRGNRQFVTGLTVNRKVNIRAEYYRTARAMCHELFTTGKYHRPVDDGEEIEQITTLYELEGILNHIYFVKETVKQRSESKDEPRDGVKRVKIAGLHRCYRDLLFFKYFLNLDKPLIICEGKTDNIYLKSAIRWLPNVHPQLGIMKDGTFSLNVRFFKYGKTPGKVLQLRGGVGDIKSLLRDYSSIKDGIDYAPKRHPVILVTDNDDGFKENLTPILKQKFGKTVKLDSTEPFFRLEDNLYLVKTPGIGDEHKSCIENFFEEDLLKTKLDGKTLNLKKVHQAENEYGKAAFADKVVRGHGKDINFAQFELLLDRIVAAIDHYSSSTASEIAAKAPHTVAVVVTTPASSVA